MVEFANSAFTDGRRRTTFSLQILKDRVQRREIGQRLKQLRERSPYSQKVLAELLGVTTRHYQNYENPGAGDFDVIEKIAEVHWEGWAKHDPEYGYVSAGWIWDGKDRRQTPDVMGKISGAAEKRLALIEEALERVEARQVEALSIVSEILQRQQVKPSRRKRSADDQAASGSP